MNKYEVLPSSSFGFICRTCLLHKDLFLIDEVRWEGIGLREILVEWTTLELEECDRLPKQMCNNCIKLMYQTYQFLSKSKSSEWTLKRILLKSDIESQKIFEQNPELIPKFICVQKVEANDEEHVNNVDKTLQDSVLESDNIENSTPGSDEDNIRPESKGFMNNLPKAVDTSCSGTSSPECRPRIKMELSSGDEEMSKEDGAEESILHEIQSIKSDIIKMRAYNRIKLRQKMKARLLNLSKNFTKPRTKGPPYKCVTCDGTFQTEQQLKIHVNDTHKKFFKFQCEFCDSKYPNISSLVAHTRTHTGEKPYQCTTCEQSFTFKSVLKRHLIRHMEEKPHRCRYCHKEFARKHMLDQHERQHTGEKLLCRYCGMEFDSPKKLIHHEKGSHPEPPNVTTTITENGYQCDTCGKVLLSEKTLHEHILLHGPRDFICETCGKSFTTNDRLLLHLRMTHESKLYCCHLCDNKYRQKNGLMGHLQSQHQTTDYSCEVCGKKFVYKGSLREHRRVHAGDSKYQCKYCEKVCVNNRRLEAHIRTHTGERPFTCDVCGKGFADKTNLHGHYKIHSKDRDYACNVCEKIFSGFRNLKIHISNAHAEKQFV